MFRLTALALIATASAFAPQASLTVRSSTTSLDASIMDTLANLQGPGQVWGADGIAVGKEESDLKGYDNFGLFVQRLQSSGVANTLSGPGPFTVFAPVDSAVQTYEAMKGPFDAAVCNLHILPASVSSAGIAGGADLTTLQGPALAYRRAFRKDFVNDAIIGEKTFGPYADYPIDIQCDNGIIHGVGLCMAS